MTRPLRTPRFDLEHRPPSWAQRAPVQVVHTIDVATSVEVAWKTLADHEAWPTWYRGVSRVEIVHGDGRRGTCRRTRAGLVTVDEEVAVFDEQRCVGLTVITASAPGLASMTELWSLEQIDATSCRLVVTVGAAARPPISWLPRQLLRFALHRSTSGCVGFSSIAT